MCVEDAGEATRAADVSDCMRPARMDVRVISDSSTGGPYSANKRGSYSLVKIIKLQPTFTERSESRVGYSSEYKNDDCEIQLQIYFFLQTAFLKCV